MADVPTKKFDYVAKNWFLTYPHCNMSPDEVLTQLKAKRDENDLELWCIGQEHHKDGSLHIHAYLSYMKSIHVRDYKYFDLTGEDTHFHGNYQTCRRAKRAIEYCSKEGFNVVTNINIEKKEGPFAKAERMIMEGKDIWEIQKELPGFILQNKRKVDELIEAVNGKAFDVRDAGFFLPTAAIATEGAFVTWPRLHGIKHTLEPLTTKKRHLWIWSEATNRGKTTWIDGLIGYAYDTETHFQDFKRNTEIFKFDAYNDKCLSATTLEKICDGKLYDIKGVKEKRWWKGWVVVCSNKSIKSMYELPFNYERLLVRFNEINVD